MPTIAIRNIIDNADCRADEAVINDGLWTEKQYYRTDEMMMFLTCCIVTAFTSGAVGWKITHKTKNKVRQAFPEILNLLTKVTFTYIVGILVR